VGSRQWQRRPHPVPVTTERLYQGNRWVEGTLYFLKGEAAEEESTRSGSVRCCSAPPPTALAGT
jgi:hypothetical protein